MKPQRALFKNLILFLIAACCCIMVQAQATTNSLKQAIETRQFVFDAQTVLPTSGTVRQLNGERYGVRVSGDSLLSDLPYFGRVYSAPLSNEGGIRFTATKFDYFIKPKKRGGWEVLIAPKGATDLRQFSLSVSQDGYATLRALSNNRQPISFNGTVRPLNQ